MTCLIEKPNYPLFKLIRLAPTETAAYTTRPSHIVAFMGVIVELLTIFGQQLYQTTPIQLPKSELSPLSAELIAMLALHSEYIALIHNRLEIRPVNRVAAIIHY